MVKVNNREHMMKNLLNFTLAAAFLASPALSGGWEASRLDSSMMYKDGMYAEVGSSSIDYDVRGTTQAGQKHKMAKDQTRTNLGFKAQYGDFDIGLTTYMSGAIQLDGQSAHATGCPTPATLCSVVPTADVTVDSMALMTRYRIKHKISTFINAWILLV